MQVKQYLSFTVWPLMMTSLVLGGGRYPPELVPFAISVEKRKKRTQALNTARELCRILPPGGLESHFQVQGPQAPDAGHTNAVGRRALAFPRLRSLGLKLGVQARGRDHVTELWPMGCHTRGPAQPMGASPEPHPPFPRSIPGHLGDTNGGAQNDHALEGRPCDCLSGPYCYLCMKILPQLALS